MTIPGAMRRVLLPLLVLLAVHAQSQPPSSSPPKSSQPKEQGTSSKETKAADNQTIPAIPPSLVDSPRTENTTDNKKGGSSADWWTRILTLVIAIATVAQAYIYWRQKELMAEALTETTKAANAATSAAESAKQTADVLIGSERAWLVVSNRQPPTIRPERQMTHYEFRFDLVNRGRTVARIVGSFPHEFRLVARGQELPPLPEYGPLYRENNELLPVHGMILAPGDSLPALPMRLWRAETEDIIEAIARGEYKLYVYAFLKYFDFADKERTLQFCYRYIGPGHDFTGEQMEARWLVDGPPEYNTHT